MTPSPVVMRAFVFFIILILSVQIAAAQSVSAKDSNMLTTIEVYENGSALWTTEIRTELTTQSGISEWNMTLQNPEKYNKTIADLNDKINMSLSSAENYSNRPMRIQNLNISFETKNVQPNPYGVIRLSYEWINFSRMDGSNLIIGDVFSEEMAPAPGNVLVIKIPPGYDVSNASPGVDRRDGTRLIWEGTIYPSFGKGQPSIILSKTVPVPADIAPVIVLVVVILAAGVLVYFVRRSNKGEEAEPGLLKGMTPGTAEEGKNPGEIPIPQASATTDINAGTSANIPGTTTAGLPDINDEILGDEEMIEKYLIKSNGQAYQTDIVKESGLSKSKISIVLAKMKEDGMIVKIRKGKENIIRLVKRQNQ